MDLAIELLVTNQNEEVTQRFQVKIKGCALHKSDLPEGWACCQFLYCLASMHGVLS